MSAVDGRKRPAGTKLAGLGFELAAAVAGFALAGYWIGGYFGNAPLGVVIGAALGVAGGMYNLIRVSLVAGKRAAGRKAESSSEED